MYKYIIVMAALLLTACGSKQKAAPVAGDTENNVVTLTAEQVKIGGIVTGSPERKNISATVKLNGVIDVPPQNMVSVSFPLGGYLKSTRLLPGMHVSKGEVLAVLEDAQFIQLQQDYLMAKSRLALTDAEFARQQEMNASKASSDKQFQQARADYEAQRITVKSLSEKLQLIGINPAALNDNSISRSVNIYSPITGFVSKVNVNIGRYTSPTEVLFELVNPEDIHLNLSVFERDVDRLKIGQRVIAFTNDNPDRKHLAEIILISKNMSENHTAEVHCHFEKYDKTLLPGMFMSAEVEIHNTDALTVPQAAVVRWQNEYYVFAEQADNTFEMVKVKPGVEEDGAQEISAADGKDIAGRRIVVANAYTLLMQMKNKNQD